MLDYREGINIHEFYKSGGHWPSSEDLGFHAMNLMFAGSFLATVGWVSVDRYSKPYTLFEQ